MQLMKVDGADVYISDDCAQWESNPMSTMRIRDLLPDILKAHPKIIEAIALYSQLTGLKGLAVLNAHGGGRGKHWVYRDGKREVKMETWIKKYDGKYAALMFLACNPEGMTPKLAKKSMLIITDRNIAAIGIDEEYSSYQEVLFNLLVPAIGEIDEYTIDYFLKKWREDVKKK